MGYGNNNGYQGNQQTKKKSGCKLNPNAKNGAACITAWNKSKSKGFVTIIASPHKKKAKTKNKSYENWMCKVQSGITTVWMLGYYNKDKNLLTIPELNWVLNPSKNYCGTFLRK